MNELPLPTELSAQKATLLAMVIYEDFPTRGRAMGVCDNLVKQFWPDVHFKFAWWCVNFLEDHGFAELATQDAIKADFVIFSGTTDKELTADVKRWFEKWPRLRDGRDGAFVDLTEAAISLNGTAQLKKIYLRDVAARALMDYVTKPPVAIHMNIRNRRSNSTARMVHSPFAFHTAPQGVAEPAAARVKA